MLWHLKDKKPSSKVVTVSRSSCNPLFSVSLCSLKGKSDGPVLSAPLQCCHQYMMMSRGQVWKVLFASVKLLGCCKQTSMLQSLCEFRMLWETVWTLPGTNCHTSESQWGVTSLSAHIDCSGFSPALLSSTYEACLLGHSQIMTEIAGSCSADTMLTILQ